MVIQDHCLPGAWGLGQGFPGWGRAEGEEQGTQLRLVPASLHIGTLGGGGVHGPPDRGEGRPRVFTRL